MERAKLIFSDIVRVKDEKLDLFEQQNSPNKEDLLGNMTNNKLKHLLEDDDDEIFTIPKRPSFRNVIAQRNKSENKP